MFFRWNAYGMFSFYPVILLKLKHWIMNMMKVVDVVVQPCTTAANRGMHGGGRGVGGYSGRYSNAPRRTKTIKRNSRCNWMLLFSEHIYNICINNTVWSEFQTAGYTSTNRKFAFWNRLSAYIWPNVAHTHPPIYATALFLFEWKMRIVCVVLFICLNFVKCIRWFIQFCCDLLLRVVDKDTWDENKKNRTHTPYSYLDSFWSNWNRF